MVPRVRGRDHRHVTNQTSTPSSSASTQRPGSNRFFSRLRSLGVVRADGWIGGVCGGIALRTGLDPLIVRGIAIVVAILGGPALFLYAVAWLLLPDTHGEIHLERMLRGIFDAPLITIGILVVLTFIPFTQGVWWLGGQIVGSTWWVAAPAAVLRVLWNLAVVGAIVWFVVWLVGRVRSTPRGQRPFGGMPQSPGGGAAWAAPTAPTAETAPAEHAGADTSAGQDGPAQASDHTASTAAPTESAQAPRAPGAGATRDDLSEWRERYAAWREQHRAWQEQQRAQSGVTREVRSAEARAQSQALAAQFAQKRLARKAANPRAAGWLVALVLGVALIAGGAAAVTAGSGELSRYAAPIGMAVALMVIGLGMVVAGAARRRGGLLAFLAIVTLVLGAGSLAWPAHDAPIGFAQLRADQNRHFTQFAGQVEVDAAAADLGAGTRRIEVDQSFGAVAIYIGDGVKARVDVTSRDSEVHPAVRRDGALVHQAELAVDAPDGAAPVERTWSNASGAPELIVDIRQGHGAVYIYEGGARPTSGYREQ